MLEAIVLQITFQITADLPEPVAKNLRQHECGRLRECVCRHQVKIEKISHKARYEHIGDHDVAVKRSYHVIHAIR